MSELGTDLAAGFVLDQDEGRSRCAQRSRPTRGWLVERALLTEVLNREEKGGVVWVGNLADLVLREPSNVSRFVGGITSEQEHVLGERRRRVIVARFRHFDDVTKAFSGRGLALSVAGFSSVPQRVLIVITM